MWHFADCAQIRDTCSICPCGPCVLFVLFVGPTVSIFSSQDRFELGPFPLPPLCRTRSNTCIGGARSPPGRCSFESCIRSLAKRTQPCPCESSSRFSSSLVVFFSLSLNPAMNNSTSGTYSRECSTLAEIQLLAAIQHLALPPATSSPLPPRPSPERCHL